MRLGIVRLQFQCPPPAGDRFLQLPLVLEGIAQVVVRHGKVGLQFQCPAVAGDRFGNPVQGPISFPQIVMEVDGVPAHADRPSNVLDGKLVFARLESNHAQKVQGIGMIRLDRENLPIELLGSLQPTALMVLHRNRKCLGNGCHGAYYNVKDDQELLSRPD